MKKQNDSLIDDRLRSCLIAIKQVDGIIDMDLHLVFDYGLDSLRMQKLCIKIEDEFGIIIPEDEARSGFFASLNGIKQYLSEYHSIV
ncbi:acyl carrier protein [Leptospira sp. GIMC2001]|uniref:acyl carrier protein n=1 Tax=Leptospira sp. GIMC2001 TaxID=1513297 RepID=UPI00234AA017|nr:acyl carrier protein [Leptospira sp. GIMC2001]WCL47818.1 acyl carrier protein [Leptospira sp. GIMC2001]